MSGREVMVVELIGVLAFTLVLGAFLLWNRRTIIASIIFVSLALTVAALALEMQSRPKPITFEMWRNYKAADVLWYELSEGVSITLVLDLGEPRLYVLAWDKKRAEQLLQAGREAEANGTKVRMGKPFERSLAEEEKLFYALPQQAPPAKPRD